MSKRLRQSARGHGPPWRRLLLEIGWIVLPLLYFTLSMLLGWTSWSWTRKEWTHDQLAALVGRSQEQLERLEGAALSRAQ
jgi:hypothetical protein